MKKKRVLILTCCILLITGIAYARSLHVISDVDMVLSSTAQVLSPPAECHGAQVCIQGDDVRFKLFGTAEANNGPIMDEGDCYNLNSISQVRNFSVILDSASSSATAYVVYFGKR